MNFGWWVLIFVVAWHVARAFVLGSVDPHGRLFDWQHEALGIPHVGGLIWFSLWLVWPAVAIMYVRANPQEADERRWW